MRFRGVLLFALLAEVIRGACADEASMAREDQLKAAYLFNFMKFVEWPASAPAEVLTVCFAGGTGVYEALASGIEGKRVGARKLAARRVQDSIDVVGCNVLYLDAAAMSEGRVISGAKNLPLLTVSDARGFARSGGMIEVFTESNRLRFNINLDNVQSARLHIGSSLLQLAATVEKGDGK